MSLQEWPSRRPLGRAPRAGSQPRRRFGERRASGFSPRRTSSSSSRTSRSTAGRCIDSPLLNGRLGAPAGNAPRLVVVGSFAGGSLRRGGGGQSFVQGDRSIPVGGRSGGFHHSVALFCARGARTGAWLDSWGKRLACPARKQDAYPTSQIPLEEATHRRVNRGRHRLAAGAWHADGSDTRRSASGGNSGRSWGRIVVRTRAAGLGHRPARRREAFPLDGGEFGLGRVVTLAGWPASWPARLAEARLRYAPSFHAAGCPTEA
jgi:hypothetical protein